MTDRGGADHSSGDSWSLREGEEVVADCHVMRLLGGGASFEAYLAFDERRLTPVVVKIVRPSQVHDERTLRGLRREIDMVGRLAHPVIVRGFHAQPDGDRPYLAMEQLHGPALSRLIRKHGALAIEQVIPLAVQLASALHYLADCGVVHLDVKPSNIIMDTTPRLIDLSIARTLEQAEQLQHVTGTDRYLAPEQADPPRTGIPSSATDVWGLGATLFHAIAGFRPFEDGSLDDEATPEQRWLQLTMPPRTLPEHVPVPLQDLILACLARDPVARPTAREVFDALEPVLARLPKPKLGNSRPR